MIFSDLKHMCPKAKALAAKYSTLLQGPSYLWNGYYQIYKCVDRLPDQAGINKVLTERPQDEVRTQAANSTEIGLHSHQEITPRCVSAEYMVSKILSHPKHLSSPTHYLEYMLAN